jgi:hypothetical protein
MKKATRHTEATIHSQDESLSSVMWCLMNRHNGYDLKTVRLMEIQATNTDGTFTIQYMLLHEEGGQATEDPATPPAMPTGLEAGLFTPPPGGHSATPRGESRMKMILTSTMMMHPYGCTPWMMCWAQRHHQVMLHESLAEVEMIVCSLSVQRSLGQWDRLSKRWCGGRQWKRSCWLSRTICWD